MSKPIKNHSENYYYNLQQRIYDRLAKLPKGTIKERLISGRRYYYLQRREGKKVLHEYLGRVIPTDLKGQLRERQALRLELDKTLQLVPRGKNCSVNSKSGDKCSCRGLRFKI